MVEQATAPEVRYSPNYLATGPLIPLLLHEKFGPPEAAQTPTEHLERCVVERFYQTEIQAQIETFGCPPKVGELSIDSDYFAQGYLAALNDLGVSDPDLGDLLSRLQEDSDAG